MRQAGGGAWSQASHLVGGDEVVAVYGGGHSSFVQAAADELHRACQDKVDSNLSLRYLENSHLRRGVLHGDTVGLQVEVALACSKLSTCFRE